jgi:hypothetical protein
VARITVPHTVREPDSWHTVVYADEEFIVPPSPGLDAIEAMERSAVFTFIRATISEHSTSQWERFRAVFNTEDLEEFAEALADLYGVTPGESEASGAT